MCVYIHIHTYICIYIYIYIYIYILYIYISIYITPTFFVLFAVCGLCCIKNRFVYET